MERKKAGLLLAAVAAYGAYRYSKMVRGRKNNLKARDKRPTNFDIPEERKPVIVNSAEYY